MNDKWEKYCKGCKYFLKPKTNVLCNNNKSCKRLSLMMLDDKEDLYEEDNEEHEDN